MHAVLVSVASEAVDLFYKLFVMRALTLYTNTPACMRQEVAGSWHSSVATQKSLTWIQTSSCMTRTNFAGSSTAYAASPDCAACMAYVVPLKTSGLDGHSSHGFGSV